MEPGRTPKPTALKLLQGNPGKRPLNEHEPQPARVVPTRPEWLAGAAAKVWDDYADLLHKNGLLTELDGMAFAMLCKSFERWAQAEKELAKTGLVLLAPSGFPIPNPWLGIATGAMDKIRELLSQFGMTPAARSKVQVAWAGQKDDGSQRGFDF